jgi:hypothetical protein
VYVGQYIKSDGSWFWVSSSFIFGRYWPMLLTRLPLRQQAAIKVIKTTSQSDLRDIKKIYNVWILSN